MNNRVKVKPFFLIACSARVEGVDAFLQKNNGYATSVEISAADVATYLTRFSTHKYIVLVSDQPQILEGQTGRSGLLAVLVRPEGCALPATRDWLLVSSLQMLEPLMDGSLTNVLSLLTLDWDKVQKRQDAIRTSFHDAVKNAGGLYIFGAGTIGQQVLNECCNANIRALGFVDNNPARQGRVEKGISIYNPLELDPSSDVVVLAVGNYAEEISNQLQSSGFQHIVNLSQFFYALSSKGQPEVDYLTDLMENRINWLALALLLADSTSRAVINSVVKHRIDLDTSALAHVKDRLVPQWFPPDLLSPDPMAVFVDGGAYDGDTAEAFRKFNGPARRIHAFELDPKIAERAKVRLANIAEAVIHPKGLSDGPARLGFVGSGITDGRIDSAVPSDRFADVVSVDDTVSEPITYLKLDVEGAEALAIAGARQQIMENTPIVGVAVYHKASDPWALTSQLMALSSKYKFFMRHYTDVGFETVIYATPHYGDEQLDKMVG